MRFSSPVSVAQLAEFIGAECFGNTQLLISGLNEIHRIEANELVFVDHPKYYKAALNCAASCILINQNVDVPANKAIIVSENPFGDFNKIISKYTQFKSSSQNVSSKAKIGVNTIIQPNVFIADDVEIGNNCIIHAGVVINNGCKIGNNVILHSNAVIGGEAFYYKKRPIGYEKLLTCGNVIIQDDVEIGANSTVDKGVTHDTIIGKGTKIDNLVQIGHDTHIGENCLIASQSGIAGCVTIKNNVTIWGQVGIASGLTINEGATIYAQSGVGKDLNANTTYFGSPADEAKIKMSELRALKKLPIFLGNK